MLLMSSADVTSLLIPRRPLGLVAALCLVLALALAVPTASKANASAHRALPQMLEISTRPWLYALSQKYGRNLTRFSDIPDAELDAIQSRVLPLFPRPLKDLSIICYIIPQCQCFQLS